jgi:hypothetical protein
LSTARPPLAEIAAAIAVARCPGCGAILNLASERLEPGWRRASAQRHRCPLGTPPATRPAAPKVASLTIYAASAVLIAAAAIGYVVATSMAPA